MQAGFGRAEWNTQGRGYRRQRHPEEVVQGDDRAVTGIQAPECCVDQFAVGKRSGRVGLHGRMQRVELDLDWSSSPAPQEVEAVVDDQAVQPSLEPVGIAKSRQVAPGADERFLDRIARELWVPEDQSGGGVQPRKAASMWRDLGGRVRQGMTSCRAESFALSGNAPRPRRLRA